MSQVLAPNLVWAASDSPAPVEATQTQQQEAVELCNDILDPLSDTNLTDKQKNALTAYRAEPANLKVLVRTVNDNTTGINKKQTVVIMGQPGTLSRRQFEASLGVFDYFEHHAILDESTTARQQREADELDKPEDGMVKAFLRLAANYLIKKPYRSLRVFPVKVLIATGLRKPPIQHVAHKRDEAVYYLENGYTPVPEETLHHVGNDIRTSLYLTGTYLLIVQINHSLFRGSMEFNPALGGLMSILTNWTLMSTVGFLLFNYVSAHYMNLNNWGQRFPFKIFRALWGYETPENDSGIFNRKGFIAKAVSRLMMTLFNQEKDEFEPLLIVADGAEVDAVADSIAKGDLPVDLAAQDSEDPKGISQVDENSSLTPEDVQYSKRWKAGKFEEVYSLPHSP